jgi:hypothetical protein
MTGACGTDGRRMAKMGSKANAENHMRLDKKMNTKQETRRKEGQPTVEILLAPPGGPRDGVRPAAGAPWHVGEAPPETPWEVRPGRALRPRRKRRIQVVRPGGPGTKRLLAQYGDRLICVRYIYDSETGRRFKTAEIILEEAAWTPERARIAPDQLVGIRVDYEELVLREAVKRAGGKWDRVLQVWVLPYRKAQDLRLHARLTHAAPREPAPPKRRYTPGGDEKKD